MHKTSPASVGFQPPCYIQVGIWPRCPRFEDAVFSLMQSEGVWTETSGGRLGTKEGIRSIHQDYSLQGIMVPLYIQCHVNYY